MAHGNSNLAHDLHAEGRPDDEPLLEADAVRAAEAAPARVRRPPFTAQEETAVAKRIDEGRRRLAEAIVGSRAALTALAGIAADVRDRVVDPLELTTTPFPVEDDATRFASSIADAVRHIGTTAPRGRSARSKSHGGKDVRAALADLLVEHGLSHRGVDRLLAELAADRAACRGATKADDVVARIRAARHEVERATAILVEANMGLVHWMAMKRGSALLPLADLVQEGTLGLMRAVEKFDYRRGVRFNTYAAWWIRHAINRALSDQSRTIRIPVHLLETRHKLSRMSRELAHQQGREPSAAELSSRSGILPETIQAVASIPKEPVSMDAPVNADGDLRLGDVIPDPRAESVVEGISARQVGSRLDGLLQTLTEREREVLKLRFGVRGSECLTFEQIGRRLSLSRERVRQIEAIALAKLRPQAAAERLDAHLSP